MATRADTFTLDGASIDSFAVNTTLKTLSVQMDTGDAHTYMTDLTMGTEITDLFLDEFVIVDGTQTLINEFEFGTDFVKSFQFDTGSDMLISNVTLYLRSSENDGRQRRRDYGARALKRGPAGVRSAWPDRFRPQETSKRSRQRASWLLPSLGNSKLWAGPIRSKRITGSFT